MNVRAFKSFRLDPANHILLRDGERIPIAPKAFDLLAYLVDRGGRLVSQDEILEALWPDTHVNPEVLRKYVLEIRKVLGDRPNAPEFIETLPKRGYRFIAPVTEADQSATLPGASLPQETSSPTPKSESKAIPLPATSLRKGRLPR